MKKGSFLCTNKKFLYGEQSWGELINLDANSPVHLVSGQNASDEYVSLT